MRANGLSALHAEWPDCSLEASHFSDKRALLAPLTEEQTRARLQDVYDRLMLAVVVPDAASVMGDSSPGCSAVLYQAFPCVRIQQPCNFATIRPYTDAM